MAIPTYGAKKGPSLSPEEIERMRERTKRPQGEFEEVERYKPNVPEDMRGPEYYKRKTREVERELPHIQRQVEFRDELLNLLKEGALRLGRAATYPVRKGAELGRRAADSIEEYNQKEKIRDAGEEALRGGSLRPVGEKAMREDSLGTLGSLREPEQEESFIERLIELIK